MSASLPYYYHHQWPFVPSLRMDNSLDTRRSIDESCNSFHCGHSNSCLRGLRRRNSFPDIVSSSSSTSGSLRSLEDEDLKKLLPDDPVVKYAMEQDKEKCVRKMEHLKHHYKEKKRNLERKYEYRLKNSIRDNNALHTVLCAQKDASRDVQNENEMLRARLSQVESQNAILIRKNQEFVQKKEAVEKWCERWYDRSKTLTRSILAFNTYLHSKQNDSSQPSNSKTEDFSKLLDYSKVNIVGSLSTEIGNIEDELEKASQSSLAALHHKLLKVMLKEEHEKWLPPFKSKQKIQQELELENQYKSTISSLEEKIRILEGETEKSNQREKKAISQLSSKEKVISELLGHIDQIDKLRWEREETILKLETEKQIMLISKNRNSIPKFNISN